MGMRCCIVLPPPLLIESFVILSSFFKKFDFVYFERIHSSRLERLLPWISITCSSVFAITRVVWLFSLIVCTGFIVSPFCFFYLNICAVHRCFCSPLFHCVETLWRVLSASNISSIPHLFPLLCLDVS